jgi:sorting nexin-1/2
VRPPGPDAYSDPISSIRRRYSDFQWLFSRLHAEKPGAIVPIIPHTLAVQKSKRFSEELVEERRGHLERFLRRVQVHPELEGAPSLSSFFSPDAEVFEAAKMRHPVDPHVDETATETERLTEKVKHFFVKTTVKAKAMRGQDLEETSDGQQMEEIEEYLNTVAVHVKALAKTTLALVKTNEDTSKNMHELGQTLFGLHQTYDPDKSTNDNHHASSNDKSTNASLSLPSLKTISSVFGSLSAIHKVKYDDNTRQVTQSILDIENSIKAARLALQRRREKQITYNTYLQQIKNRTATLEKAQHAASVQPPSTANDAKISDAQKSLETARHSSQSALDELIQVTERVFREMDRFKRNLDGELRRVYVRHGRVQMDYSRQLEGEYAKLLNFGGGDGGLEKKEYVGGVSGDQQQPQEADVLMI